MVSRVLVVEKEKKVAELIAYGLKREGHEPVTVANGCTALRLLREDAGFKHIFVSQEVGLVDGLKVVQKMRSQRATAAIPCTLLSANEAELSVLAEAVKKYPCTTFVPKPIINLRGMFRELGLVQPPAPETVSSR